MRVRLSMTGPKGALTSDIVLVSVATMQPLQSFWNIHVLPAAISNSEGTFYPNRLLRSIMAANEQPCVKNDAMASDVESEGPTSQSSMGGVDAHHAAAAANVERKAIERKKIAAKRKADRVLQMPGASNVSELHLSLEAAIKKRDDIKKEVKAESKAVKLARKRVDRVKAKAKVLSNNDLYEVYLMRMETERKQKEKMATKENKSSV